MTPERRTAIALTVGQRFTEIAEATNALEFDRLLGQYRESEDLTYVAGGRVTRSHEAFSDIMDAQFGGVTNADLRWRDIFVDVLSPEVAVVTATFEFNATLESGDVARSSGTYMCIYVLHDGRWQIQYSAHSFPMNSG
ncbi:MAG: nuclear transport factor 2 family protein [Fidelibacterota bacterium]|nr:MAG: nuclear transport factor 2 family protein [Candidatus Neomarinimicrobiota bacterium]